MTMNPLVKEITVPGKAVCQYCNKSDVNSLEWGPLYQLAGVTVHYFCMVRIAYFNCGGGDIWHLDFACNKLVITDCFCCLFLILQLFSAGLSQNGEDEQGILGFMPFDINKELKRGDKLV